jgi:hypothetical protein
MDSQLQSRISVQSRQSSETSQNTPLVPDSESAALLSGIIDRARMAMGWNRLPQSKNPEEENSEQDVAIITWYEILVDAGVPEERWMNCYRSAQQRENERRRQGKERQIVTPNDLVVEWDKIKELHYELDKSRLLPENAASACQRCFGTGKEEMPDGSVKDECSHLPLSAADIEERAQAKARSIEFMREAMKKMSAPKPAAPQKPRFVNIRMKCNGCGRCVDNDGVMWKDSYLSPSGRARHFRAGKFYDSTTFQL